jgi:hypothetical protein
VARQAEVGPLGRFFARFLLEAVDFHVELEVRVLRDGIEAGGCWLGLGFDARLRFFESWVLFPRGVAYVVLVRRRLFSFDAYPGGDVSES